MKYRQMAPQQLDLELIASDVSDQPLQLPQQCAICTSKQSIHQLNAELVHEKYFETFNFYFAKPINEILADNMTEHVILFKDFLFLYDENEYFKRFYKFEEVQPRINILTDFYTKDYKQTRPNLCSVDQHRLILNRNEKQAKLFIKKLKTQEQPQQVKNTQIKHKILPDRFTDSLSIPQTYSENSISSAPKQNISWDSQSHNIFEVTSTLRHSISKSICLFYQSQAKQLPQSYNNNAILKNFFGIVQEKNLYTNENDSDLKKIFSKVNCLASEQIVTQMNLLKIHPCSQDFTKKFIKEKQEQPKNYSSNHQQSEDDRKNVAASNDEQQKLPYLEQPNTQRKLIDKAQEAIIIKNLMKRYEEQRNQPKKAALVEDKQKSKEKQAKMTITDEMLLKIQRQFTKNFQKKSIPIQVKKNLIKGGGNSQSSENLASNRTKVITKKQNNCKKTDKRHDSKSSENPVFLRNQYYSQASYKYPQIQPFQSLQVQSSVSINNPTVLNNNEERGKMDLKKGKSSNIKGTKASIQSQSEEWEYIKENKQEDIEFIVADNFFPQYDIANAQLRKARVQSLNQRTYQAGIENYSSYLLVQQIDFMVSNQSQSQLLRSLSSKVSLSQSPVRRAEIGANLVKLIEKQDNEMKMGEGYWTERPCDVKQEWWSERVRMVSSMQWRRGEQ